MIVLARHGHTDVGKGKCIGRTDVPLSALGKEQASIVADVLHVFKFKKLLSSPAVRAVDTLGPLADRLGVKPEVLSALHEIDMGEWDGLFFEDIRTRFPTAYDERGKNFGSFRAPGGESFNDVADRAMGAITRLARGPQPILAVTHAGVIRAILCRLTGHPMDDLFHFRPAHATCVVLSSSPEGMEVTATDVSPHDIPRIRHVHPPSLPKHSLS